MRRMTWKHYTWLLAIVITIILAICKSSYWYVPIVAYLIVVPMSIVIKAFFAGKIKNLPYAIKMAFQTMKMKKPAKRR